MIHRMRMYASTHAQSVCHTNLIHVKVLKNCIITVKLVMDHSVLSTLVKNAMSPGIVGKYSSNKVYFHRQVVKV